MCFEYDKNLKHKTFDEDIIRKLMLFNIDTDDELVDIATILQGKSIRVDSLIQLITTSIFYKMSKICILFKTMQCMCLINYADRYLIFYFPI